MKTPLPKKPAPGCGAPPERAGLYWVADAAGGRMIAVCEGTAPFLRVRLIDPWEDGKHRTFEATQKLIEALVWRGEIALPPEDRP